MNRWSSLKKLPIAVTNHFNEEGGGEMKTVEKIKGVIKVFESKECIEEDRSTDH